MNQDLSGPIILDFKSAQEGRLASSKALRTFDSYHFERNMLVPASGFRFTAPGVDKSLRTGIRSGDLIEVFAVGNNGIPQQIATGIIDETDTHCTPTKVEYVLTGRDSVGQLVDNAAVDKANRVIQTKNLSLESILNQLVKNTRIPSGIIKQQLPDGLLLFQTNPGETKINALQRYLEFTNCLVWSMPNGQIKIGKPDFTQNVSGKLILNRTDPSSNNLLDARVRRNLNQAIRQIVTQLQTLSIVDAGAFTNQNNDPDMRKVSSAGVGRSVFDLFSYGQGTDSVNQIIQVGNSSGDPKKIGDAKSKRELARENMKILDVECVLRGHLNSSGNVFDVDQIYEVQIEDDDVSENMFVYSVSHELTLDHGRMTRLRLCRLGTIVVADQFRRTT